MTLEVTYSDKPYNLESFEHCVLDSFRTCFNSCDAQFGFKKYLGCRNAIYVVRTIVYKIIAGGNTVSICAIDLTKAFDKLTITVYS